MKRIVHPERSEWSLLCRRPGLDFDRVRSIVEPILRTVQMEGDEALRRYTAQFDRVDIGDLRVTAAEIDQACEKVPHDLRHAIEQARRNIETFHRSEWPEHREVETMPGIRCWRRSIPIERVGLYVPGGTAPLVSTALMLAVPATLAGCREIVACTPPTCNGAIDPALLYVFRAVGVGTVIQAGGAQAIAALAYGTKSVPRVDKIFGPGNQYVTVAQQLVAQQGVAIGLPAGPSEVLVIADDTADPEVVAADLLAQAEHGGDSEVLLATDSAGLAERVEAALSAQAAATPRRAFAEKSLAVSRLLVFPDIDTAMEFSNAYAPEHLIIQTADADRLADAVQHAGSVFIGPYAAEAGGDYATGPNHTLPVGGLARSMSGLSLESFLRQVTFQTLSREGFRAVAPVVERLAEAEGLFAHGNAMKIRREKLRD